MASRVQQKLMAVQTTKALSPPLSPVQTELSPLHFGPGPVLVPVAGSPDSRNPENPRFLIAVSADA